MIDPTYTDAERLIPYEIDGTKYCIGIRNKSARLFVDGKELGYFWAPYLPSELLDIQYAVTPSKQLVLAHPNYRPYVVEKLGGEWGLSAIQFNPIS